MDDKNRPVAGFGIRTPNEALEEITEGSDDFYLPLCLLFIFWDFIVIFPIIAYFKKFKAVFWV